MLRGDAGDDILTGSPGDDVINGGAGTLVALSNGEGSFGAATLALDNFGRMQGWATQDGFARTLLISTMTGLPIWLASLLQESW